MKNLICSTFLAISLSSSGFEIPSWILDTNVKGYITGLGSAELKLDKKNAIKWQKKSATLKAKADLIKNISVFIKNEESISNTKGTIDFSNWSIESAGETLDNSNVEVLKVWHDPKTKVLYKLVGLKIN